MTHVHCHARRTRKRHWDPGEATCCGLPLAYMRPVLVASADLATCVRCSGPRHKHPAVSP